MRSKRTVQLCGSRRSGYKEEGVARGANTNGAEVGRYYWRVVNANVAKSGDVAHVYGTHEFKEEVKLRPAI